MIDISSYLKVGFSLKHLMKLFIVTAVGLTLLNGVQFDQYVYGFKSAEISNQNNKNLGSLSFESAKLELERNASGEIEISEYSINYLYPFEYDNVENNFILADIEFKINKQDLLNKQINGVIDVYSNKGSLIKSYFYQDGFTASDGGIVEFFMVLDRDIDKVNLIIYFTDMTRDNILSNVIVTEVEYT